MKPIVEPGSWSELRIWVAKAPVEEVLHGSKLPELLDSILLPTNGSQVAAFGDETSARAATAEELDFLASTFKRLFKLLLTNKEDVVAFLKEIFLDRPSSQAMTTQSRIKSNDEKASEDGFASSLSSILFTSLHSPFKPLILKGTDLLLALAQLLNGLRTHAPDYGVLDTLLEPVLRRACAPLTVGTSTSKYGNPLSKIDLLILSKLLKPCPPITLTSASSHHLPPSLLNNLFVSLATPKERDLAGQRGKVLVELFGVEGYLMRDAERGGRPDVGSDLDTNGMGGLGDVESLRIEDEGWNKDVVGDQRGIARRRILLVSELLQWVEPTSFLTLTTTSASGPLKPGKESQSPTSKRDLETLLDGLGKYVLPTLFREDPLIGGLLLDRLSAPAYEVTSATAPPTSTTPTPTRTPTAHTYNSVPSYIQILLIYLLNTSSNPPILIPKDTFLLACEHRSHSVRLAAWRCLVESREEKRRLGEGVRFVCGGGEREVGNESVYWEVLERFIRGNVNVWSVDFRSAFLSSFNTFAKRLQSTVALSHRQLQRPSSSENLDDPIRTEHQTYIDAVNGLIPRLVHELILPIIKWPLKSNYAKMITAIEMLRSLMEVDLQVLRGVRGPVIRIGHAMRDRLWQNGSPSDEEVQSGEVVDALFACLASNYKDVRDRAAKLIDMCQSVGWSKEEADALMDEAFARLDGARNTDAETGGLLLGAINRKAPMEVRGLLTRMVDNDVGPSDGSSSGVIPASPGPSKKDLEFDQARYLGVLLRLIDRLEVHLDNCEGNLATGVRDTPLHGILFALATIVDGLDQRRQISRTVIQQLFDRLLAMIRRTWAIARQVLVPQDDSGSPDHESVRVNAFLDADEDQQDVPAGEVSEDLLVVLSNSWRSMKEASNLLAAIHRNSHFLWIITAEENASSGQLFLTWLSEIRHRGTFSSIATSFESFLDVMRRLSAGRTVQQEWLEHVINGMAQEHRSTTRRSAALPYCVLALIQGGESYFRIALQRLLANVNDGSTTSEAKVHSINVLRVLLNDARQTTYLSACFEDCMQTSLTAYGSQDWSVRNAALHLFSTLIVRVFGRDINKATADLQQAMALEATLLKYPRLIPMWQEVLSTPESSDSASFLVILALRVLRVSTDLSEAKALRVRLVVYLRSPEVKLRMAASEAYAALTTPVSATAFVLQFIKHAVAAGNENQAHGLLFASMALVTIRGLAIPSFNQEDLTSALALLRDSRVNHSDQYNEVAKALRASLGSEALSPTDHSDVSGAAIPWDVAFSDVSEVSARIDALHSIAATEVAEMNGAFASSPRWDSLHRSFERSAIVPLREAILPVLALLTLREDNERTSQVLEYARLAAGVDLSAESRLAAALCVKHIARIHLGQDNDGDISIRLACLDLVWTLLQDDDEDIRDIATDIVARGYADSAPLSQARAVEIWMEIAQEMSDDEAVVWEGLVWKRLDFENRLARIAEEQSERSELFASEPANIFVEEHVDIQQISDVYIRNLPALPGDDRISIFARRRGELLKLRSPSTLHDKISPIDPRRESKMMQALVVSTMKAIEAAME